MTARGAAAPAPRRSLDRVPSVASPAFDVAVIGAGPAGVAATVHLVDRGLRTVLIDKARFPATSVAATG